MENEILQLELTVAEINVILRCLGKHPFDEVVSLVTKIKGQGETQLGEIQQARSGDNITPSSDTSAGGTD